MIIQGESDQGQREHEERKRKFEQQRVGQTQSSIHGQFNKRPGLQGHQGGSFMRQGAGNQGPVIQSPDSNQPRLVKQPLAKL